MVAERSPRTFGETPSTLGSVEAADELVLTTAARSLRRALGPTAWAVLEELTSQGTLHAEGVVVVATNLRGLAEALGLGRDAVAGALQALALAGWVRSEPARGTGGRFGAGRYLVSANDALRRAPAVVLAPSRRPTRSPKASSQRPEQLTLLDLAPSERLSHATSHATAATTP